ncbi:GGDEF domain-containing protein [Thiobacter aerophilum]|uniref:diguanylate cyclase n=1 Tax=Thiobacter aerophilum TaxID=3121275 RepID=A0ABV0EFY6_9BURK
MPPASNPTELARETLKQLAARRIAPTPENYQRIYRELAGTAPETAAAEGVEENLARILESLGSQLPAQAPRLRQLAQAVEARDWETFGSTLGSLVKPQEEAPANWAEIIRELIRQWDLKQLGLTTPRKKEALERVLINFGRNPTVLAQKLAALTRVWAEGASGPSDIKLAPPIPEVPIDRRGAPINVPLVEELPALLAELLAQALREGVLPRLGHVPRLAAQAERLAEQARNARTPEDFAILSQALRQFWIQLELQTEAEAGVLDGLMRLLRLVIENISELLLDDQWLRGQLTVVQDIISRPLNARVIADAEKRFKEVIFKQGTLKHSLNEAKTTLKNLVTVFIERITEMSESTGGYRKKIERYTEILSGTEDLPTLNQILQDILADTRSMHLDMVRSHDELVAARQQVEAAEARIKQLEAELGEISELVYQDYLTGTLNRRGLEDAFEREFARAERHGLPVSIALLDVDHFKRLNDTYGHEAGDQALVHLAKVVKDILRPTDVVARYGGEEFVIILPDTTAEDAVKIMTRLQRNLTKHFFLHDNQRILITFSAGVAQREGRESAESMIARADEALYRAKQAGRNRVFLAKPLQSSAG